MTQDAHRARSLPTATAFSVGGVPIARGGRQPNPQPGATPPPPPPQLVHITALPNGYSADGARLRLSLVLSWRLTGGTTLKDFPNPRHWTRTLRSGPIAVALRCGTNTHTVSFTLEGLNPDLWEGAFSDTTPVNAFQFQDLAAKKVSSLSIRQSIAAIKNVYQVAGIAFPQGRPSAVQLQPLVAGFNPSLTAAQRAEIARRVGDAEQDPPAPPAPKGEKAPAVPSPADAAPAAGTSFALLGAIAPLATNAHVVQAARTRGLHAVVTPGQLEAVYADHAAVTQAFLSLQRSATATPTPPKPPTLDFHQTLTALGSYPTLQRALGLVWDIEVPASFAPPTSGAPGRIIVLDKIVIPGGPQAASGSERAITADGWMDGTVIQGASTMYHRTEPAAGKAGEFVAASRGTIKDGLLALDDQFSIVQVDVDGALHKTINTASIVTEHDTAQGGLASLRSSGLSLVQDGRANHALDRWTRATSQNAELLQGRARESDLYAEDLIRGYRVDIWDDQTRRWHSLHRRSEVFRSPRSGAHLEYQDQEGFIQLSVTKQPGDPEALDLQETIARWAGWSLSAPHPGTHLSRKPEPNEAVPKDKTTDPDYVPDPNLPLLASFAVVPGSLPRLRYGTGYRMRVRVVDIAGNGVTWSEAPDTGATVPPAPEVKAYVRHESVLAPAVVPRDVAAATDPGSDVATLVIRTYNDDPARDGDGIAAPAERHIAPPRIAALTAEQHGVFDGPNGRLNGEKRTYDLIATRDAGQFALQDLQTRAPVAADAPPERRKTAIPVEPAAQLTLPYLPDPMARGAALSDLPGTGTNVLGWVAPLHDAVRLAGEVLEAMAGGKAILPTTPASGASGPSATNLTYGALTGDTPRPGSMTLVDFGETPAWPDPQPFRLVLAEGDAPPAWDPIARTLTVRLPKASRAASSLSSYVTPEQLKLLGAWKWLREYADGYAAELIQQHKDSPLLAGLLDAHAGIVAEWVRSALEGGHHQLTPSRALTLLHAVQQPLGTPLFLTLTPIRQAGASAVDLIGGVRVHGASTAKVDLHARWHEYVDAPDDPRGYRIRPAEAHVDELPLPSPTGYGLISASGNPPRPVGLYTAEPDRLLFVEPQAPAPAGAHPRHYLRDTRHYVVEYTAEATSRFRDYFVKGDQYLHKDGSLSSEPLSFTRRSEPMRVHVPSAARPAAPRVRYVVPTFGWQRHTSTNIKVSLRHGKGLRVYMDGPWFSSGEGELLGVVLLGRFAVTHQEHEPPILAQTLTPPAGTSTPGKGRAGGAWGMMLAALAEPPSDQEREQLKPFITQWGMDPIWLTARPMIALPTFSAFPRRVAEASELKISELKASAKVPEVSTLLAVAGHTVGYDATRKLWYCDLTVDPGDVYAPFVRLALARYQPHSLPGLELSPVVLCDFAQLTPDRSAIVTYDPYNPRKLTLTVAGPTPVQPQSTSLTVGVQRRTQVRSDLGWEPAPEHPASNGVVTITHDPTAAPEAASGAIAWHGTLTFHQDYTPGEYRIILQEYEAIAQDPLASTPHGRLIYAETIELDGALVAPAAPTTAHTSGSGTPSASAPGSSGTTGGQITPSAPASSASAPPPASAPASSDPAPPSGGIPTSGGTPPTAAPGATPAQPSGGSPSAPATPSAPPATPPARSLPPTGALASSTPATSPSGSSAAAPVDDPAAPSARVSVLSSYQGITPLALPSVQQGMTDAISGLGDSYIHTLQHLLNDNGAVPSLIVDGNFGPATGAAVFAFQQAHGIPANGIVDPQTWTALVASAPPERLTVLNQGWSGPMVRILQLLLNANGTVPLTVDGAFSTLTTQAVTSFQQAKGLDVDGQVGKQTWAALQTTLTAPASIGPDNQNKNSLVGPPWHPLPDPPLPSAMDFAQLPTLRRVPDADLNNANPYVKLAQALFNGASDAQEPLDIDGAFGDLTDAATRAFQESQLIDADGVIGPQTWLALSLACHHPLLESGLDGPPMAGPPVAAVQHLLNLASADPQLAITGSFDGSTQVAIRSFQQSRNLPVTSMADPMTWRALTPMEGELSPTTKLFLSNFANALIMAGIESSVLLAALARLTPGSPPTLPIGDA